MLKNKEYYIKKAENKANKVSNIKNLNYLRRCINYINDNYTGSNTHKAIRFQMECTHFDTLATLGAYNHFKELILKEKELVNN